MKINEDCVVILNLDSSFHDKSPCKNEKIASYTKSLVNSGKVHLDSHLTPFDLPLPESSYKNLCAGHWITEVSGIVWLRLPTVLVLADYRIPPEESELIVFAKAINSLIDNQYQCLSDALNSFSETKAPKQKKPDTEVKKTQENKPAEIQDNDPKTFFSSLSSWVMSSINRFRKLNEKEFNKSIQEMNSKLTSNNIVLHQREMLLDGLNSVCRGIPEEQISNRIRGAVRQRIVSIFDEMKLRRPELLDSIGSAVATHGFARILVCGMNGVGKTTSIAKMAYALKNAGYVVGLVACDVFRTGAVEQLQVHADALGIEIFQRGYRLSAREVAQYALKEAEGRVQVLIFDTAGRMHSDDSLMKQMKNISQTVNPDLSIAVVDGQGGADCFSQQSSFTATLENQEMKLDGYFITKVDTVANKVGMMVNIAQNTNSTIYYLGTGQTYNDLVKLNPTAVADALLA